MVDSIRRKRTYPEPVPPRRRLRSPSTTATARRRIPREIIQPQQVRYGERQGILRVVTTIVFVVVIIVAAGLYAFIQSGSDIELPGFLKGLSSTPPPDVVRKEEFNQVTEEIRNEIATRGTDTIAWRTYDNGNHGFSVSYPPDWDVEELPPAFDPLIVKHFAIQPRGKKYFREPQQIYPVTLEVIEGSESEVRELYPAELAEAAQQIRVGDTIVQAELRATGEFLYLLETPDPTKWFVIKDSVGTIGDVSDAEKEELRSKTKIIIASFEARL